MNMYKITSFNEFCYDTCNGLYTPGLPDEQQSSGYQKLKHMVINKITPASVEETKRWRISPTFEELISIPDIKYMQFLHPILRHFVIRYWDFILNLTI